MWVRPNPAQKRKAQSGNNREKNKVSWFVSEEEKKGRMCLCVIAVVCGNHHTRNKNIYTAAELKVHCLIICHCDIK